MIIRDCSCDSDLEAVRGLFYAYYQYLAGFGLDLSFQGIQSELADLPGSFAPPHGRLILAWEADQPVGCGALHPIDACTGEIKRMYVLPAMQGKGIGKAIATYLVDEARWIGYRSLRLDTAVFLTSARQLYQSLGFKEIAPYNDTPADLLKIAVFMELQLDKG